MTELSTKYPEKNNVTTVNIEYNINAFAIAYSPHPLESIMKDWLIPIFDNDIQLYLDEGNESIMDAIEISENKTDGTYSDIIMNNLKYNNPIVPKEGIGYSTQEYSGTILRNCIQDTCTGINGEYIYDERKTR